MHYTELLLERPLRVVANNSVFTVWVNPTAQQIVRLFEQSRTDVLKGVIIEDAMYWWDGYYAHHGHILELFDRNYPRPYEVNGVDCRMIINMECDDRPTLSCDDGLLNHPALHRVLVSDLIWFIVYGAGCMTYSQYRSYRAGDKNWRNAAPIS